MESKYLEYKNELELQKMRVRKIRKSVNSLTDEMVCHLNRINRVLTEFEKTLDNHPNIEEFYVYNPKTCKHIAKPITEHC